MVETKELPGVLTKDREVEEFTRDNFGKKFGIIIDDILDKGIRKKVKSQVFQDLIQNVYEPCYNQLKNKYDRDEFITTIPPNPWKDKISNRWKLNTEEDIESLFEEYSAELKIWHEMWIDFANNFQGKEKALGGLLTLTFQRFDGVMDWWDKYNTTKHDLKLTVTSVKYKHVVTAIVALHTLQRLVHAKTSTDWIQLHGSDLLDISKWKKKTELLWITHHELFSTYTAPKKILNV